MTELTKMRAGMQDHWAASAAADDAEVDVGGEEAVAVADETPRRMPAVPTRRGIRRGAQGLFERRNAERLCREEIVERARHLPDVPRAILTAHFDLGMTIDDLATI